MKTLKKLLKIVWIFNAFLTFALPSFSQHINLKGCYGSTYGHGTEETTISQTLDGGFILSSSIAYTWPTPSDYWVAKVDSSYNLQWEKIFGGSDEDYCGGAVQTKDSGFYVTGFSQSIDGDVSGNHGAIDVFILKLDPSGNIIHSRCFGGTGTEWKSRIIATPDGGCLFGTSASSSDGDVIGIHSANVPDVWLVKLDTMLNIQWQHCYGGTKVESLISIDATQDGGYVFGANAQSTDGDLTNNYGSTPSFDIWVVKIDSIGNIIWSHDIGGSGDDRVGNVLSLPDNSVLMTGHTSSTDFDVINNHGSSDVWLVKYDSLGSLLWKKCYGGSGAEDVRSTIQTSDHGLIVNASTNSTNGQVTGYTSITPTWIFKVDSIGDLQWEDCVEGGFFDIINADNQRVFAICASSGCVAPSDMEIAEILPSNIISGKVFVDYNSNNICDLSEPIYPNELITSSSSFETLYTYTNSEGNYNTFPIAGNYNTTIPNGISYYSFSPPLYNYTFTSTGNYITEDFSLTPFPGIHDVSIQLLPVIAAFAGMQVHYSIHYNNAGTDTSSGFVYYNKPPLLTFISSSITPNFTIGDSMVWSYSSLEPLQDSSIDIILYVPLPPTVNPGDLLLSNAGIISNNTDTTPADNVSNINEYVYGSYDPNDKLVLSGDSIYQNQIAAGDYIIYMIRFQNTGNSPALNIMVYDSISDLLDMNSIQMVAASNSYLLNRLSDKVLKWSFENINLPDSSTNESGSHGYICFKIKPKNNLIGGDRIHNFAEIYFDQNPAIITNNAEILVLGVNNIENLNSVNQVALFPNPATNRCTVTLKNNKNISSINLFDEFGTKHLSVSNSNSINLAELADGIYIMEIEVDGESIYYKKIVKSN